MLNRKILLIVLACAPTIAVADPGSVYKVEKNGVPEFVSKAPASDVKPEKLPPLGHWKVDTSTAAANATCDAHGGIDCASGPDTDGSVVCLDKFKDSLQRFNFECTAAKLNIVQVSEPDATGFFKVTVRNAKGVAAKKSSVRFKPNHMDEGIKLSGPDQIEAYEIGEFEFQSAGDVKVRTKPKLSQLIVTCENCD